MWVLVEVSGCKWLLVAVFVVVVGGSYWLLVAYFSQSDWSSVVSWVVYGRTFSVASCFCFSIHIGPSAVFAVKILPISLLSRPPLTWQPRFDHFLAVQWQDLAFCGGVQFPFWLKIFFLFVFVFFGFCYLTAGKIFSPVWPNSFSFQFGLLPVLFPLFWVWHLDIYFTRFFPDVFWSRVVRHATSWREPILPPWRSVYKSSRTNVLVAPRTERWRVAEGRRCCPN